MKITRTMTKLSACLCMTVGMLATGSAQAAPGPITQAPLFIGNAVAPNIFFLTDDSLSMIVEMLTSDSAGSGYITSNSVPEPDRENFIHREKIDGPGECDFGGGTSLGYLFVLEMQRTVPGDIVATEIINRECNVTAEEERHARDYRFNQLYYNPNQVYPPWAGVDINGNAYTDMDVTDARLDPYDPSRGTINLLEDSALTDRSDGADGDRDYYHSSDWRHWCSDNGIRSGCEGWRYYYYDADGSRQLRWVHELPVDSRSGETNTQTNFANWFTYHRSRDYAAKYALSTVISEATGTRIGFSPINDWNYSVAVADTNPAHRHTILTNLFANRPSGNTPLLSALNSAGEYFEQGVASGLGPSPILSAAEGGTCQMNATILTTDGFYTDGAGSVPSAITNDDAYSGNGFDGNSFADEYSKTLADIAMHYFESDLAPGLPNRVLLTKKESESIGQEYLHQHMNTYTIAFGLEGTLDPSIAPTDAGFAGWPNPTLGDAEKIDDLRHAAYNGRGEFLSADSPQQLVAALASATGGISEDKGSPAKVVFSDYRLNDTSKVFSSRFSPANWNGEFRARAIINSQEISEDILWDAAEELRTNPDRQIISFNGNTGIPFQWDDLSLRQQVSLGRGDATDGENRLDYLRGDQSNEGPSGYRERLSLLGDIINSGPEYVGKPRVLFPNTELFGAPSHLYYDFWRHYQERTPVVYVGANDGMLHGFDANTGEELLAYVPEAVYDNLRFLTDPSYTHRFFVDSSAKQFDALFSPQGDGPAAWHTVLTGGLGAGGKAWYALDITNPDNFRERDADEIVLWEFGEGDDKEDPTDPSELSDVGYSFSQPTVILTNAEKGGHKRWAVVTGNGYNSASGIAKLFIIFLDADPSDGWQAGPEADYIEISTDFGGPTEAAINGLSSPYPVDTDGDWIIDHIYAGDVKGNLWAFDISSERASRWRVAYRTGSTPQPLFTAVNASGDIQPITARPTVIRHPQIRRKSSNTPNVMVYFGTGQYLTADDPSNADTQSFYAIWDQGQGGLTRDSLTTQVMATSYGTTTTGEAPAVVLDARFTQSDITVPYTDTVSPLRFGWLLDLDSELAASGERVFTSAYIQHEVVYFTTFQPNAASCGAGGSGWFMTLDALNGGPPPQPVLDLNRNNVVDMDDGVLNPDGDVTVTSGTRTDGNGGGASFTSEGVTPSAPDSGQPLLTKKWSGPNQQNGRLSWKELRP